MNYKIDKLMARSLRSLAGVLYGGVQEISSRRCSIITISDIVIILTMYLITLIIAKKPLRVILLYL